MNSMSTLLKGLYRHVGKLALYMLIVILSKTGNYSDNDYYVSYMDVGQGDAIYIHLDKKNILIDGGPYSYLSHKIDSYIKGENVLDYLIITHPHADHYLGMFSLLSRYHIKHVVINPVCVNDTLYQSLISKFHNSEIIFSTYISLSYDATNSNLEFQNINAVRNLDLTNGCVKAKYNLNNSSIVTRLVIGGKEYLFMGDSEDDREDNLLKSNLIPKDVYILKAGHHCSNSSSSNMFLEAVSPKYVVCSYGKNNKYGHPSKDLIKEFQKRNIEILSTEKLGDIVINLSP